jgi:hypothetical protein
MGKGVAIQEISITFGECLQEVARAIGLRQDDFVSGSSFLGTADQLLWSLQAIILKEGLYDSSNPSIVTCSAELKAVLNNSSKVQTPRKKMATKQSGKDSTMQQMNTTVRSTESPLTPQSGLIPTPLPAPGLSRVKAVLSTNDVCSKRLTLLISAFPTIHFVFISNPQQFCSSSQDGSAPNEEESDSFRRGRDNTPTT